MSVLLSLSGANTPPITFTTGNWPQSAMYTDGFKLSLTMNRSAASHYASEGTYMIFLSFETTPFHCVTFVKGGTADTWTVAMWNSGVIIQSAALTWNATDTLTIEVKFSATTNAAYLKISGAQSGNGQVNGTYDPALLPAADSLLVNNEIAFGTRVDASFGDILTIDVPATVSSPTPSGTLATAATATIGATTNQASGTFYCVVDSAANLSGVTASQIKAGQKASGAAALAAANSSVSTTTPSAGVTGLTASTLYSYAIVQNNANGDSNVLTGTFTTAAPTPTLSDVDTDETITITQTNIVVTGVALGASQGASVLRIIQGPVNRIQSSIDSWSATSIQFDISAEG